jgi:hypothetical protein
VCPHHVGGPPRSPPNASSFHLATLAANTPYAATSHRSLAHFPRRLTHHRRIVSARRPSGSDVSVLIDSGQARSPACNAHRDRAGRAARLALRSAACRPWSQARPKRTRGPPLTSRGARGCATQPSLHNEATDILPAVSGTKVLTDRIRTVMIGSPGHPSALLGRCCGTIWWLGLRTDADPGDLIALELLRSNAAQIESSPGHLRIHSRRLATRATPERRGRRAPSLDQRGNDGQGARICERVVALLRRRGPIDPAPPRGPRCSREPRGRTSVLARSKA